MSSKKPLVSIITVYYNREKSAKKSIESILNQSFSNFEFLLVDDGSSDSTLSEFNKFNDERIRVITHENMGFTKSIRKAVELAKAPIIAVHGSGDYSFKERIEEQYNFLTENPDYSLVASRFEKFDEVSGKKMSDSKFSGDVDYEVLLTKLGFTHGSVMYRKDAYQKVGGYEPTFVWGSDWELFLRLIKDSKAMVLDRVLYRKVMRMDGASFNPDKTILQCKFNILQQYMAVDENKRSQILGKLKKEGVDSLIPDHDPQLQKKLLKKNLKLLELGRINEFEIIKARINPKYLNSKGKFVYYLSNIVYFFVKLFSFKPKSLTVFFNKFSFLKKIKLFERFYKKL